MLSMFLKAACHPFTSATALIKKGLLVPPAGPEIVRLLPPLNVSADEIDQALQLIKEALDAHLKS